jgi:hypothetical protein
MRSRGTILVFAAPTTVALWFIYAYVFNYMGGDPGQFGIYLQRRQWLTMHMLAGTVAILLGPAQLWLGLNRKTSILHRVLGIGYVVATGIGGTAALYLAFHTDFGWVFGMGLTGMACAWMITTALATIAICRGMTQQHREWMIRSYVVTFAFVTFRTLTMLFEVMRAGTLVERMTAASWLSWSVPLLITETVIQGWKIFARVPTAVPLQAANAYSVSPEQPAFGLHSSESSYLRRP